MQFSASAIGEQGRRPRACSRHFVMKWMHPRRHLIEVDVVEFVIAIGDTVESFDASKVTFDRLTRAIGDAVEHPSLAPIRLRRRGPRPLCIGEVLVFSGPAAQPCCNSGTSRD